MKFGIMQYLLAGENDVDRFQHAARLGFLGVEPELRREDLQDAKSSRLAALKSAREKTKLAIPSLCLGEYNGLIAKEDKTERAAAIAEIKRAVDWAVELGAKVILVPFFFAGELKTEEDFARAADGFKQICAVAEKKGVKVAYEGTYPAEKLLALARAVGSVAFGDYFDLANVVWLGMNTADQIRKRGALIAQVHFKESLEGPGDCRPGKGRVDYAASAEALKEIGYDSWLVFEVPKGGDVDIRADIAIARYYFPIK